MSQSTASNLFQKLYTGSDKSHLYLSKLLTLIERSFWDLSPQDRQQLYDQKPHATRVGFTGPPGAGKSTITDHYINYLGSKERKVAVLAIDPSSPFSGGALLGDRIRYQGQKLNSNIFIRSLGTRGSRGGMTSYAPFMLKVFDHFGFDDIIIETVGVGQTELDIMTLVNTVCVVLVPEAGDGIQGMKAGLTEIGDLFLVNKSDRPGSEGFARELEQHLRLSMSAKTQNAQVYQTSALKNEGLTKVFNKLDLLAKTKTPNSRMNLKSLALDCLEQKLSDLDLDLNKLSDIRNIILKLK